MPPFAPATCAVILMILATACGSGSTKPSNPLAAAATRTEEAGTARVDSTSRGSFAGSTYTHRRFGVVDYEHDFVSITKQSTIAGEALDPSRHIELNGFFYTEESATMKLPPGKRWVREKEGNGQSTGSGDPTRFLGYIRGWASKVEVVGRRSVRGIPTTIYRARLDLRSAVEHDLKAHSWTESAIEQFLGEEFRRPATVEAAVGRDGLIRRIVVKSWSSLSRQTETLVLSDFGLHVDVEPPPADTVVDYS